MADTKTILILSDEINEASESIRRALNALFDRQYNFQCSVYDEMEKRGHDSKGTAVRDWVIHEFEVRAKVLQQSYAHYLERADEDNGGKKEEGTVSALIALEAVINKNFIRSNRFGGGIADQLRNITPKKRQEEQEKEKLKSAHDKQAKLTAFENDIANLKNSLFAKLSDMPMDFEPALVEALRQEIMDIFSQYIQKMESSGKALSQGASVSMQSFPSIISIQRDAISGVNNAICLTIIVVINDQERADGIRFLRRHWAELVKYNLAPSPAIFLSLQNIQELVRRDKRYFVLHSEGVEVLSVPFQIASLREIIQRLVDRPLSTESIKSHLRQSADLASGAIIEHKWKNFAAPLSLLRGARAVGDIDGNTYQSVLKALQKNDEAAYEETFIYEATDEHLDAKGDAASIITNNETLATLLGGKRILLIDDEAEASGMKRVLDSLCGSGVIDAIHPNRGNRWRNAENLLADSKVAKLLSNVSELEQYGLILLDLYLTEEDEALKKQDPHSRPRDGKEFGGLSLLHRMTEDDDFTVPVVLFTATTRAFNIREAEKCGKGIAGYVQKRAVYGNKDDAISYYREFKDLIAKATDQDSVLLRFTRKGITLYKRRSDKQEEILKHLEAAYLSLATYLRDNNYNHLIATAVILGSAVELLGNRGWNILRSLNRININQIYASMVMQIRGSAAHPDQAIVDSNDIYFAFYSLLISIGIKPIPPLTDYCSSWSITATAVEKMISAICNNT